MVSPEQTFAALQRSAQWRKHADLIASREPSDVWRELCWRYMAFPSRVAGKDAELVFAIRLDHHRKPTVLSALVDTATGAVLPLAGCAREARSGAGAGLPAGPSWHTGRARSPGRKGSLPGVGGSGRRQFRPKIEHCCQISVGSAGWRPARLATGLGELGGEPLWSFLNEYWVLVESRIKLQS